MANTLLDWTLYVLGLVRRSDPTAELMVVGREVFDPMPPGDVYAIATVQGPPRETMGVRVVQVAV